MIKKLEINNSGNVGGGMTSPNYKLHVFAQSVIKICQDVDKFNKLTEIQKILYSMGYSIEQIVKENTL